jgi:ketosteroid isomerase-like protein
MAPSPTERDDLFKSFARALFRGDMDELYRVATPDFLWRFHDGLAVTKSLADAASIAGHLAEQKARFAAQRFHDVAYHHSGDMSFKTFRVSETVGPPASAHHTEAFRQGLNETGYTEGPSLNATSTGQQR